MKYQCEFVVSSPRTRTGSGITRGNATTHITRQTRLLQHRESTPHSNGPSPHPQQENHPSRQRASPAALSARKHLFFYGQEEPSQAKRRRGETNTPRVSSTTNTPNANSTPRPGPSSANTSRTPKSTSDITKLTPGASNQTPKTSTTAIGIPKTNTRTLTTHPKSIPLTIIKAPATATKFSEELRITRIVEHTINTNAAPIRQSSDGAIGHQKTAGPTTITMPKPAEARI